MRKPVGTSEAQHLQECINGRANLQRDFGTKGTVCNSGYTVAGIRVKIQNALNLLPIACAVPAHRCNASIIS